MRAKLDLNNLIEACDLAKHYPNATALKDISLTLKAGEIVGLLGPNGSGKTTAIHIFLGLLAATKGQVKVLGLSPLTERYHIAPLINFSSAYVQLPANLTLTENLLLFARLYGVKKPREKIRELLELFDMEEMAERKTGELSSGERTRLNLCKCLLNDPVLLLLDEPTASMDPEMGEIVRLKLEKIRKERGVGILYTSHNMSEVDKLCDRILFINHGHIMAEGTPADLKTRYSCATLEEVFLKLVRQAPGGGA